MIEKIKIKNLLIAIIIRSNFSQPGTVFLTNQNLGQQIATINYKKGFNINAHFHEPWKREVQKTMETIIVKSGKLRVDFYDKKGSYFFSKILIEKDVILFVDGGHGFEFLEESNIIEIKQGPFLRDDRIFFKKINSKKIKIKK